MTKVVTQNKNINLKDKKGFTLLFAILVSILVLAVGASMITIALKQVILSGAGRESQYAFYAANTGAECAIYWDLNGTQLINGEIHYVFPPPQQTRLTDLSAVKCGGGDIVLGTGFTSQPFTGPWIVSDSQTRNTTTFKMVVDNEISGLVGNVLYCVEVTVEKEEISDEVITTVTAQGLNTCDPEGNPRAVQRGLVLKYRS